MAQSPRLGAASSPGRMGELSCGGGGGGHNPRAAEIFLAGPRPRSMVTKNGNSTPPSPYPLPHSGGEGRVRRTGEAAHGQRSLVRGADAARSGRRRGRGGGTAAPL